MTSLQEHIDIRGRWNQRTSLISRVAIFETGRLLSCFFSKCIFIYLYKQSTKVSSNSHCTFRFTIKTEITFQRQACEWFYFLLSLSVHINSLRIGNIWLPIYIYYITRSYSASAGEVHYVLGSKRRHFARSFCILLLFGQVLTFQVNRQM